MIVYKDDRQAHKYYELYLKKRDKKAQTHAMQDSLPFAYFKAETELYVMTEFVGKKAASTSDLNKALNAMVEQLVETSEKQNVATLRILRQGTLFERMGDQAAELDKFLQETGYYTAQSKRAWSRMNTKKLQVWLEEHGGVEAFRRFYNS